MHLCLKPDNILAIELHYFYNGSEVAYGSIVYIRYICKDRSVCSPLMAKARLTPLSNTTFRTIPRVELNAARLSVCLHQIMCKGKELDFLIDAKHFWTDSTTVLKYLNNDSARYQRFISNRVAFIRSSTAKHQCHFVPSRENPADIVSRGMSVAKFVCDETWKIDPKFLAESTSEWPTESPDLTLSNDLELMDYTTNALNCATTRLAESASDWYSLKVRVAYLLRPKSVLRRKYAESNTKYLCMNWIRQSLRYGGM